MKRVVCATTALIVLTALSGLAGTLNFSINTSAVAGSALKVVFDVTANTLLLNEVDIDNFSAPGSTMGLPETTGGLIDGDLILGLNPAPFTSIQTKVFFNELIVNLAPVAKSVAFSLFYTENAPSGSILPDDVALFLLDSSYTPLFPTSDPLGTDALASIDLTGPNPKPNVYSPAIQTSPGNVSITIPGQGTATPEPGTLFFTLTAAAAVAFKTKVPMRRAHR